MLQLIVLRHETVQNSREFLNLTGKFELLNQTIGVLCQFFRLDFLVSVQLVDSVVQLFNLLTSFLVFVGFVISQILSQNLSRKLTEGSSENIALELEELVNDVFILDRVENVSSQSDYIF